MPDLATPSIARRPVIMSDGTEIATYMEGNPAGPMVMFSNSLGTDHQMWDPQAAALAQDFRILRYDTRGHGHSGSPAGAYSIDRLSLDVIEILDALEIGQVHFCGLSLGGMIGQQLGWRAPDRFLTMTLAATSAYMGPPSAWQDRIGRVRAEGMAAIAESVLDIWFTPAFQASHPGAVAACKGTLLGTDAAGYSACCAAIRDMDQRPLGGLSSLPTLVISGQQDKATPPSHGKALSDRLTNARFEVLDGGHLVNLEQPTAFTKHLVEFINHNAAQEAKGSI